MKLLQELNQISKAETRRTGGRETYKALNEALERFIDLQGERAVLSDLIDTLIGEIEEEAFSCGFKCAVRLMFESLK